MSRPDQSRETEIAGRSLRARLLHALVFGVVCVLFDVLEEGWASADWSGLAVAPLFFVLLLFGDVVWQWHLDA